MSRPSGSRDPGTTPAVLFVLMGLISAALIAGALGAVWNASTFVSAWMPVAFWVLDLSLGALVIRWIYDLSGGDWGSFSQPVMRACGSALPIGLAAALALGWAARDQLAWLDHPEQIPQAFVDTGPAIVRSIAYAGVWSALAFFSGAWRRGDVPRNRPLGAIALVLHLPLATLFAFDWLLALQPQWYSSAIGARYLSSQAVAGFAIVVLVQSLVSRRLDNEYARQQRQDLGTLLLASILFWAYVTFMEFLIIWIGNLPREIPWYLQRSTAGWIAVLCAAVAFKLVIPGALLCSRTCKRHPDVLAGIAALVLVGHLLDFIWQMAPAFPASAVARTGLIVAGVAGLGGCWVLLLMYAPAAQEASTRSRGSPHE